MTKKMIKGRAIPTLLGVLLCVGVLTGTAFAYVEEDANAGADAATMEGSSLSLTLAGEEVTTTTESVRTGTVTNTEGAKLNVRSGAGMEYDVIGQLGPGDTVEVTGEDGDWYQVKYSDTTGYVSNEFLTVTDSSTTENVSLNLDEDTITALMSLFLQSTDTSSSKESEALTPDGNLTLVDDIGTDTTSGKQFITLATKSGNVFYLIIDRDDEGNENVHFLNLVDERDLLYLMDEDEAEEYQSETEEPEATESTEPEESTTDPETETEPEPEETEQKSTNLLPIAVLLLVLLAGGGAFLYKQMQKKKQTEQERPDPDADYLDSDEEDTIDLPELAEEDPVEDYWDEKDEYSDDEPV